MSWASTYVGIPYADLGRTPSGCDCWGLARLVYAHELSIALPSYTGDYVSADEIRDIDALIRQETAKATWLRTEQVQPFDLLLFRQHRYGSHVGIHIEGDRMLHLAEEEHAKVARYSDPRWNKRLVGAFRHIERTVKEGF